jgi:hypothetical protein
MCVQIENISKAIKFVNHGFHIIKTYSHIPRTLWTLLVCGYNTQAPKGHLIDEFSWPEEDFIIITTFSIVQLHIPPITIRYTDIWGSDGGDYEE